MKHPERAMGEESKTDILRDIAALLGCSLSEIARCICNESTKANLTCLRELLRSKLNGNGHHA